MRLGLGLAGAGAIGYGLVLALGLVWDGTASLVGVGAWWLAGPVVVDLLAVPAVVLAGVLIRRVVAPRWRRAVAAAAAVTVMLTLVAAPFLTGLGRRPDNPSLLDRDYVAGYLVLVALVWVAALLSVRRPHRGVRDAK